MNKLTSSYFGSFTTGFVNYILETLSCLSRKQLRALYVNIANAHQWQNRPRSGKNDLEVDSRSFIHCIEKAESHYTSRDMHVETVPDAYVCVNTPRFAGPVKPGPKLSPSGWSSTVFLTLQFASPVFSAFQSTQM